MESKEVKWLREVLHEDQDAPTPKRVKVSDIHNSLETQFTPNQYSHRAVSTFIRDAFPQSHTKPTGHKRVAHLHGVDWKRDTPHTMYQSPGVQGSSAPPTMEAAALYTENQELYSKVSMLEAKVRELEQCSTRVLTEEATTVIRHGQLICSGPDTLEHFEQYSFAGIVDELKTHASNLLQLVLQIGQTSRNTSSDEISKEHIKAMVSLCTLLNARSVRTKGMQLMVSLMLIARATSRQVRGLMYVSIMKYKFIEYDTN